MKAATVLEVGSMLSFHVETSIKVMYFERCNCLHIGANDEMGCDM